MRGAWICCVALLGCGPSLKTLVESDMRFEHCYRIDEDARVPIEDKRACWGDWTKRYARGQDRSRITYAKDRVKVLSGAVVVAPAATGVACPSPASPYSPPPQIAADDPSAPTAKPAAQACNDACSQAWKVCINPCGKGAECFSQCDASFKGCIKACF